MIRLVVGDLHLSADPRERYRLDFALNEIPKLDDTYKPDQIILLGDLCHEKDNHPASLVNEIVDLFARLAKQVEIIILQGNHDFSHVGHPYFQFLKNIKGITWVGRPTVIAGSLFLPHTRDYNRDWAKVDFRGHDFIFAHNIFTGAAAGGQKLSGIPVNALPKIARVISGDVHEPQTFGQITYVGAPYLCTYGEDYEPRVLLLTGVEVQSLRVGGPQKRLINVSVAEVNGIRELLFDDSIRSARPGDFCKIRVTLPMKFKADWVSIRQEVLGWFRDLVISSIVPIVEYVPGDRVELSGSFKKSDAEYFKAYVDRVALDKFTAQVGEGLMRENSGEVQ